MLRERLASYRADRERRSAAMVQALRELGFEIDDEPIRQRAAIGKSVGRPHIAQAVVDHPANASRLAAEAISEQSAFLEAYLVEGRPAFRPRELPTVAEAIAAIHDADGLAVWAHPFFDFTDPQLVLDAIERFKLDGIDGIAGIQGAIAGLSWLVFGQMAGNDGIYFFGGVVFFATSAFLIHNWQPARVFMGDVGSAFLGFTFAATPFLARQDAGGMAQLLPFAAILFVWFFLFDSIVTFVRRAFRREKPAQRPDARPAAQVTR